MVASIGAYVSIASFVFFFVVMWVTFRRGAVAAANPWGEGATTLEWQVPSPPAFHTFEELPRIR
jgi:cytochrome c oxidase subunit 1